MQRVVAILPTTANAAPTTARRDRSYSPVRANVSLRRAAPSPFQGRRRLWLLRIVLQFVANAFWLPTNNGIC